MGILTNFKLIHQKIAEARVLAKASGVKLDLPDEAGIEAAIERAYDFRHKRKRTAAEIEAMTPPMTATITTQVSQPQMLAEETKPNKKKRASK